MTKSIYGTNTGLKEELESVHSNLFLELFLFIS